MSAPDLTAQHLYDLRERTGFISGNDLHDALNDLVGEMAPTGATAIEWDDLSSHWIADAIRSIPVDSPKVFADVVREYTSEEATDEDGWMAFMFHAYLPAN